MLDSVIIARDRFLRPGGAILPDLARIYVAAAGQGATGLTFWQNVYGLDMSVIGDTLRRSALTEALVRPVHPQDLCTEGVLVKSLDVATMTAEDQDFTAEFTLRPGAGPRECHALVLWFDTLFTDRFCKEAPQELPTGPEAPPTHWAQTVLVLPRTVTLAPAVANAQGAAVALQGRISMARRAGRHRTLDISVEYAPLWADGTKGDTVVQMYAMGVSTGS
jgi:type I protein arginine methyltransferase